MMAARFANRGVEALRSPHNTQIVKEIGNGNVVFGESNEENRKSVYEGYSQELKEKKQQTYRLYGGYNGLVDESKKVRLRMKRTFGCRGEIMKGEELFIKIGRCYTESQTKFKSY